MRRSQLQLTLEIAIFAAFSVVLSLFKIYEAPQGGSISLEMLPIFFIALRRGLPSGIATGLLVGVLGLIFRPDVVHPLQFLFDYPLAFGVLGVAGIFSRQLHTRIVNDKTIVSTIILAVFSGTLLRLLCHFISGVAFFAAYTPKGQNVFLYSISYNLSYLIPTGVIVAIILSLLPKRIFIVK